MNLKWYHYMAVFFAGVFLINAIPHLFHGVSGLEFPTPFANPPGEGLSSATVNVIWGMFNILVGYILLQISKVTNKDKIGVLILFVGMTFAGIMLSMMF